MFWKVLKISNSTNWVMKGSLHGFHLNLDDSNKWATLSDSRNVMITLCLYLQFKLNDFNVEISINMHTFRILFVMFYGTEFVFVSFLFHFCNRKYWGDLLIKSNLKRRWWLYWNVTLRFGTISIFCWNNRKGMTYLLWKIR